MSEIKFASFNCRGIGDFRKRKDVFAYLRNQDFNICFLQDIHCSNMGAPYFRNCWGTDVLIAPYTNNARGVAILTKGIEARFSETTIDENGNFIITKFRTDDEYDFCLVNIYGPNSDDPSFYNNVLQKIREISDGIDIPIIIAGDFNLTLDQSVDNFNYRRENNTRARAAVKGMMSEVDLMDIYIGKGTQGLRDIHGELEIQWSSRRG